MASEVWTFAHERPKYFDQTLPRCPECGDEMKAIIVGAFPLQCRCDKCGVTAGRYAYKPRTAGEYGTKVMEAAK